MFSLCVMFSFSVSCFHSPFHRIMSAIPEVFASAWAQPKKPVSGRFKFCSPGMRLSAEDGRISQMIFGIPDLIVVISASFTLQPGDIIATGLLEHLLVGWLTVPDY